MPINRPTRLIVAALLLAWCFDQLFWRKTPGISFPIFTLLCLAAGFWLTWVEKRPIASSSLPVLIPILFFSAMSFLRQEPFTQFLNYTFTLWCLALLSITWMGGKWWQYTLFDHLWSSFRWMGLILAKPPQLLRSPQPANPETDAPTDQPTTSSAAPRRFPSKAIAAILRGLLLALPVVFVLAGLLVQADPVFSRELQRLLKIEKLGEYIFRLVYILIIAYLFSGALLYLLLSSADEKVTSGEKPLVAPFLGWLEAATLLFSVDLLYAFFVAVQFKYFFGGQANINLEGFTYAEYARRGFGELVIVAILSLLLFLGLSVITRRKQSWPRRVFSGLGVALVALVGVILVSAFQRLLLYEAAYGFSRLRTYSHVFMFWLGALLLATILLETTGRLRHFALALVIASLGFGATLNLLNVDGFVASQNVARAQQGEALDIPYLVSLSDDSVPTLFRLFHASQLPHSVKDKAGATLACRAALAQGSTPTPWPSLNISQEQARRLLQTYQPELDAYPTSQDAGHWQVFINQFPQNCVQPDYWMD